MEPGGRRGSKMKRSAQRSAEIRGLHRWNWPRWDRTPRCERARADGSGRRSRPEPRTAAGLHLASHLLPPLGGAVAPRQRSAKRWARAPASRCLHPGATTALLGRGMLRPLCPVCGTTSSLPAACGGDIGAQVAVIWCSPPRSTPCWLPGAKARYGSQTSLTRPRAWQASGGRLAGAGGGRGASWARCGGVKVLRFLSFAMENCQPSR